MNFHTNKIMHVTNVVLLVNDLAKMKEFYTNIMGFSTLSDNSEAVVLTVNNKPILTLQLSETPVENNNLYHIAYLLNKRQALASFVAHLIKHQIRFGGGDHLVSEAIYFDDPEGNGIEVYADRNYQNWEWVFDEVSMTTKAVNFKDLLSVDYDEFTKMPKTTIIGHLHLQVSDMKANEKFYVEGLGFKVVNRFGDNALFLSDYNYHHLAFNRWHKVDKLAVDSLKSQTIKIKDESKRDKLLNRLKETDFKVDLANKSVVDTNGIVINFK